MYAFKCGKKYNVDIKKYCITHFAVIEKTGPVEQNLKNKLKYEHCPSCT